MRITQGLLLLAFLSFYPIKASLYPDYRSIYFSKIKQSDGLSHNNVECIFKDSDGFVWFGTRNGLCRYDGYKIKIYRSTYGINSISGDRILSINEDINGNLWIGTYGNGLNKFDKIRESFTYYLNNDESGYRINKIAVFKNGDVWVCTNNGLAKYISESDNFKVFRTDNQYPNSLKSNNIYDIIETSLGEIYVATESHFIQKYNPENHEFIEIRYKRAPGLNKNYRKRIIEDMEGVLWIAADVHGLCSYNPKTKTSEIFLQGENQLTTNVLTGDMALDREGNLWISTDGCGINIFNPYTRKFQYIRHNEQNEGSISSDHIYCIYFDDMNTIWVGTFGDGVNFYDPSMYKFNSYYRKPDDLKVFTGKSILSLFQDSKNRLWIGTDGEGLYMLTPDGKLKNFRHWPQHINSVSANAITSINEDSKGNILIGTYSGGLNSFNVEKSIFTRFNEQSQNISKIHSGNVWRIFPDSKDRIWLGLLGNGVDLFDSETKTFTNYGLVSTRPDRVDFPNVMAILEDSDGDIWFGSEGRGIYILDSETDKIYRIETDSVNNITTDGLIKCLYQDRWGSIWIGTEGHGLYKLNKKTNELKHYDIKDGIPTNIVQSIIEDSQENLWIGTSNGLCFFNPKTESFRNFIKEDGLSGNVFNQNAMVRLTDGRFACGTTNGINIFKPENIKFNQNLPRIVFTCIEVLNKEIHPGDTINNKVILTKNINFTKELTLSYKEKVFSLEFAALNYTLPKKCFYKYKLEGFDDKWYFTSSDRRRVSYSNLQPGNYVFRLLASNNDGKWGNNERTLKISILPPFYRTLWFRLLVIIIITSLIYAFYRYRLNIHKNRFLQKQAEQEKKIMALEKEKLESELKKLTFHIINRNRVLIDQKNRLMGLSVKAKESVKVGLQDIISIIDEDLNEDKDWKYIEPQLDKVYNNFVTRLKEKHPDLNVSEIKIAAYVRMNLSTKEISEFMHKTPRAVENDRYRLRKKIGLDSNNSLQNYLINL